MTDSWLMAKARLGKQEASLPVDENQVLNAGNKMIQVIQKQKNKNKKEIDDKHLKISWLM